MQSCNASTSWINCSIVGACPKPLLETISSPVRMTSRKNVLAEPLFHFSIKPPEHTSSTTSAPHLCIEPFKSKRRPTIGICTKNSYVEHGWQCDRLTPPSMRTPSRYTTHQMESAVGIP